MRISKLFAVLTAVILCAMPPFRIAAEDKTDVFFDDFTGSKLDSSKWLTAEKNWGGTVEADGKAVDYNGGVIPENVEIRDGNLILTGLGNKYEGELRGIHRDGTEREDGSRCGGAIATKEYYASGSYEIRAKIAPVLGCCSAMWTFEYEEDYSGDTLQITNHEIDIEFPGRDANDDFSLSHVLCTTWVTEEDYKTNSVPCGNQADGSFHTYRFDWHTGSNTETPRVEYYFDDELIHTAYDDIPTNESRFWLGLWFPKNWAGTPDFKTTEFVIDYVKITPFHESGDTPQHESYPDHGWAEPVAELPKGWLLWQSYSQYSALDSKLYLRSPDGNTQEITGDFIHAMNGSFGNSPERFTFMAIDQIADEWDVFLYDAGEITNLTPNSGYRNEDPKFSPDGKAIVFKRGFWSEEAGDFVCNLALIDVESGEITMLTNDLAEEAMPCFSADCTKLYYTRYSAGIGSIICQNLQTNEQEIIFSEPGVNAYYPVISGEKLYFTKWLNADNRCDQLVCYDGTKLQRLPFNSEEYDSSDICPIAENAFIFSSTADGEYDLFYFDGTSACPLTDISTGQNDLGADFFPSVAGDVNADGMLDVSDIVLLQKWILAIPGTKLFLPEAADLDGDGCLDVFDLGLMKQKLLENGLFT